MATKPARMIAAARAISGDTQQQLADKLTAASGNRWTRNDVASIENGRRRFAVDDLMLFADVQDQPYSWYLPSDSVTRSLPFPSPHLREHAA